MWTRRVATLPVNVLLQSIRRYFRATEVETLLGNASKARIKLGWNPKTSFHELLLEMVREDFKSLERDEMEKRCGYVVSKNYEFTSSFKDPKKLLMFARKSVTSFNHD
jgi:hypothetical protein